MPNLTSETDTSYFGLEFTRSEVALSPVPSPMDLTVPLQGRRETFSGYSYCRSCGSEAGSAASSLAIRSEIL